VSPLTQSVDSATVAGVEDVPELAFVRPLPGFNELRRFVLVEIGGEDGQEPVLFELRSLEEPAVRFLAAVPTAFFPDYAFELDEAECADLGLKNESDALVLVLLTIGREPAETTANLLAPVVVNARTRAAAQVILSGSDWPVHAPVG
jgi:flagellar assembly factor FliW